MLRCYVCGNECEEVPASQKCGQIGRKYLSFSHKFPVTNKDCL